MLPYASTAAAFLPTLARGEPIWGGEDSSGSLFPVGRISLEAPDVLRILVLLIPVPLVCMIGERDWIVDAPPSSAFSFDLFRKIFGVMLVVLCVLSALISRAGGLVCSASISAEIVDESAMER